MPATQGTLVLADISGYTAYMAGTEHEHSIEILKELMETIARSFDERLRIDQLEGDALCATTERTDAEVATWLHDTFGRFHERLRDIRELSTCPCRACASAGDLGLKFIVHRGEFSRQQIGQQVQLYGTDVNLVHRLAKNTVPLREYLFATAATLVPQPVLRKAQRPTRFGVLYFGSTSPAMQEALDVLTEQGVDLDAMRLRAFPFPESVDKFIAGHDKVFVVEQNRDAQMHAMLVNELSIDPARLVKVLHYDGTPITARFITRAIEQHLQPAQSNTLQKEAA